MTGGGLSKDGLERVINFEGYGNKLADYWFVGMEEGGGSIEQLRERAKLFHPVEDLESAVKILGIDITKYSSTWSGMSMLIMAMQGTPDWQDTATAREYQSTKLGRIDGESFLTDLMPLPCKNINDWPYPMLFPTKANYIEQVRPGRIRWLNAEISVSLPKFVICYGKGNWSYYKEIFNNVEFEPEFDGKILVGERGRTSIILLNFLSPDLVKKELIAQIAVTFGTKGVPG